MPARRGILHEFLQIYALLMQNKHDGSSMSITQEPPGLHDCTSEVVSMEDDGEEMDVDFMGPVPLLEEVVG
jgi:hypothetical protein